MNSFRTRWADRRSGPRIPVALALPGLILVCLFPVRGETRHQAGVQVSARVVAVQPARTGDGRSSSVRATVDRNDGARGLAVVVESSSPARRIETVSRDARTGTESVRRRVVTVLTP